MRADLIIVVCVSYMYREVCSQATQTKMPSI
jgi:hypothetical protein